MAHIIGRGRTARETYPRSSAAGGGATNAPLSRQRFIDGDTSQAALNGSASSPFQTIAQFMAVRDANAAQSDDDSLVNFVGWVMPAEPLGYVEDVDFTAYASTELRASSEGAAPGVSVVGDVRWDNVAGINTPSSAIVSMHNIGIVGGSFVVTDDVGAPSSAVFLYSDGAGVSIPAFDSSVTTELASVLFHGITVGTVDAGVTADSAVVSAVRAQINGDITGLSLNAQETTFGASVSAITVNNSATFTDCRFNVAAATVLTAPNGARFDGPSWHSFLEAGGTRAAGTVVLITGGYAAAPVDGADVTTLTVSVSLNGVGATAGFEDGGNRYSVANTGNSVTLLTGGALEGDTILIRKPLLVGNPLIVRNSVGTAIATVSGVERGFVLARFESGEWVMEQCGSLAA